MDHSATLILKKSIFIALIFSFLLSISTVVSAMATSHISRWVHTGFHMHKKSYEDERVVLKLLKNSSFDLNYIGYFENDDDTTWEKTIEATGSYQILENNIVFKVAVLVGSEDRDKPLYSCPFTVNKKSFILSKCELLNIDITYKFKRTDPDAFHFN